MSHSFGGWRYKFKALRKACSACGLSGWVPLVPCLRVPGSLKFWTSLAGGHILPTSWPSPWATISLHLFLSWPHQIILGSYLQRPNMVTLMSTKGSEQHIFGNPISTHNGISAVPGTLPSNENLSMFHVSHSSKRVLNACYGFCLNVPPKPHAVIDGVSSEVAGPTTWFWHWFMVQC